MTTGVPSISAATSRRAVLVEVGDGDPRALRRQPPDGGGADARRASRHERGASFESHRGDA